MSLFHLFLYNFFARCLIISITKPYKWTDLNYFIYLGHLLSPFKINKQTKRSELDRNEKFPYAFVLALRLMFIHLYKF